MTRLATILLALAGLAAASASLAHEFKIGDLIIDHPQSRAMIAGAKVGGGFMTITNAGPADDRLVSATSTAATDVQIHEMTREGDVMRMAPLADGLVIPAGQTVELKPGGLHVMFMGVATPFREGDRVKASLTFEKAGTVEVEFEVGPANGAAVTHDSGQPAGVQTQGEDGHDGAHGAMDHQAN